MVVSRIQPNGPRGMAGHQPETPPEGRQARGRRRGLVFSHTARSIGLYPIYTSTWASMIPFLSRAKENWRRKRKKLDWYWLDLKCSRTQKHIILHLNVCELDFLESLSAIFVTHLCLSFRFDCTDQPQCSAQALASLASPHCNGIGDQDLGQPVHQRRCTAGRPQRRYMPPAFVQKQHVFTVQMHFRSAVDVCNVFALSFLRDAANEFVENCAGLLSFPCLLFLYFFYWSPLGFAVSLLFMFCALLRYTTIEKKQC